MINSETLYTTQNKVKEFPKLMENENVIVLMHDETIGIVVHSKLERAVPAGRLFKNNFDIDMLSDYKGFITISNE